MALPQQGTIDSYSRTLRRSETGHFDRCLDDSLQPSELKRLLCPAIALQQLCWSTIKLSISAGLASFSIRYQLCSIARWSQG